MTRLGQTRTAELLPSWTHPVGWGRARRPCVHAFLGGDWLALQLGRFLGFLEFWPVLFQLFGGKGDRVASFCWLAWATF